MSSELDIERLLRWREERAEAHAPTPPRAAHLLQLVEEFETSARRSVPTRPASPTSTARTFTASSPPT